MQYYPIKMKPLFKEMPWGGSQMKTMYNKDIPSASTGESWEMSAIDGSESSAENGVFADMTLDRIIALDPCAILGSACPDGKMPLLFKIIDAQKPLSVQVHPGNEYAKLHENGLGKTEMWYVLSADDGAGIYAGFTHPISCCEYKTHIKNNTLDKILNFIPVSRGDFVFLPAGMVHAIGAGLMICEIQQSSATTYRVYDWGRVGLDGKARKLHIEQALDVSNLRMIGKKTEIPTPCTYFGCELISPSKNAIIDTHGESFSIIFVPDGEAAVCGGAQSVTLHSGDTCFIPARAKCHISSNCEILRFFVPSNRCTNKTAIFDLDGTLLNTLNDLADSVNTALSRFGYPTHEVDSYRYFVGSGADALVRRALPKDVGGDDIIFHKVLDEYKKIYEENYLCKTKPYDGVHDMLTRLMSDGVKICVLSNKPHIKTNEMIHHYFPDIDFCVIHGGRDGIALKPDPQSILDVLSLSAGEPAKTFYMGDSDIDMKTACGAGAYAAAALWGFRDADELIAAGADALCLTPSDALECAEDFFAN